MSPEELDRYAAAKKLITDRIPFARTPRSLVLPDGTWKAPGWPDRDLREIGLKEWQSEVRSRERAFAEYAMAALAQHPGALVVGIEYETNSR